MRTLTTFCRLSLLPLIISAAACDVPPTDELPGDDAPAPALAADTRTAPDGVGVVELALATIPDGVQCLRVSAKGPYREKLTLLAVTAGAAFAQTLSGLPLGRVVFFGEAFDAACDDVTARTIPAFASDEVVISIVEGGKGRVELRMLRNGRADVSIEFSDEPACSAEGVLCRSKTECCVGTCTAGVCTLTPPAPMP